MNHSEVAVHLLGSHSRRAHRIVPSVALLAGIALALASRPTPSLAQSFALGIQLDFATGTNARSVAVGDVNGDGRPDLAVANQGSSTVSVLLGDGAGNFGAKTDFATGTTPYSVAMGDVNGDGRPDLVTANYGSNTLSVLLGDGAGGFGAKTDFPTGIQPVWVAIGDLNGDGRPDLVAALLYAGKVSVLLGDGAGNFGSQTDFFAYGGTLSVAIGDLNGDGRPDLAAANNSTNTVSVLLGDGAGGFGARTNFATATGLYSLAIGDVNGDGRLDLVTANYFSKTLSVLLGDGAGGFGAKTDFATATGAYSVAIGDVNGDGRPDLVTACDTGVSVLLGSGAGGFGAESIFAAGAGYLSAAIGDVNGDGRPDLVAAGDGSNKVSVLLGNGTGCLGASTDFATGTSPYSVALADVNGDGRPDLAVANSGSNTVSVLLDNGAGGFAAKVDFATGSAPYSVAIGDLNRDGRPDLAVANSGSNTVSVLLGNGLGGFGAKSDFATRINPQSVAIGDVNLDLKPDLAVADYGSDSLSVLLGDGAGGFGPQSVYAAGVRPRSVVVSDVVGPTGSDGWPDLVVGNDNAGTLTVVRGSGAGFSGRSTYTTGGSAISVAVGDVNGDGRRDVVTANGYGNSVSVLTGSPYFHLDPKKDFPTGVYASSVAIGDINGDGRADLAVTSLNENTASVLLGSGDARLSVRFEFGPKTDIATGANPNSVAIGDVNGDGRSDLVVTNQSSKSVSLLLGRVPTLTALTVGPNPAVLGSPLTFTATVSIPAPGYGTPSDSVRFFDGTTLLGTSPVNGGVAGLALFAPYLGDRVIKAVHMGDGKRFGSFSGVVTQKVFATAAAKVTSITDAKNDQGGSVRLVFGRSPFDCLGSGTPITGYQVYRRAITAAATRARPAGLERTSDPSAVQLAGWDYVTTVPATTDGTYQANVPTLADSNTSGLHRSVLFVRAATATPGMFYDSPADSGYSVDNLPPAPPAPFTAAYSAGATHLHWGASTEPDLWYYQLHRGSSAGFAPGASNLIATPADTGYVDAGGAGSYYKLAAVDANGNVSGFAALSPGGTLGVPGDQPIAFALRGANPNPANSAHLQVEFVLPSARPARLDLLDVSGRRVRTLEVGGLGPGRHMVDLAAGRRLAPGLYMVRLSQGDNVRVSRVAVID